MDTFSSFVLMNAERYATNNEERQYEPLEVLKELNKCVCGFSGIQEDFIATGNWGCGCYCGDVILKFIIQWTAATLTDSKLIYCAFDPPVLTVAELTCLMLKAIEAKRNCMDCSLSQCIFG